mgnify:FL=1
MTKVKICGLRTLADVRLVNQYLPEYAGFVFAKTRRLVADDQALLMRQMLDQRIQCVGVFVNEPIAHVIRLCDMNAIDAVQLHGDEPESYIRQIKDKTGITVIKAVRVQCSDQVVEDMSENADFMLFDTYKKGIPGGTGERFPMEVLQESFTKLRERNQIIKPYFLAGGLDCDSVAQVICRTNCYAVDVSTGVETDGIKNGEKIKNFLNIVRQL